MTDSKRRVNVPKLSRLELQIMERLWSEGNSCVREIQESFPEALRPAYTTVQTIVSRLERKGVVKRVAKNGNSFIFAPATSRNAAQRRLVDELLSLFGGRIQPVIAHLVQSEQLTAEDVKDAYQLLRQRTIQEKSK